MEGRRYEAPRRFGRRQRIYWSIAFVISGFERLRSDRAYAREIGSSPRCWECALVSVDAPKTRKVLLRLGVVLGPSGGFLGVLGKLTRWFLGGQVGSGQQYISWIHVADVSRMVLTSIENQELTGVFNASSPN